MDRREAERREFVHVVQKLQYRAMVQIARGFAKQARDWFQAGKLTTDYVVALHCFMRGNQIRQEALRVARMAARYRREFSKP